MISYIMCMVQGITNQIVLIAHIPVINAKHCYQLSLLNVLLIVLCFMIMMWCYNIKHNQAQ